MTIIFMTIITMMGIAPLPWSVQHQGQEPTHYEAMPEKVNIETIFPTLKTYSPSSLVTHIEALLSTGIRLQTHKDSSCRYTRPGLQASLYCLQPA